MNSIARLMIAAVFGLSSALASAQCATGVNTGGGNCVPPDAAGMPGYQPQGDEANAAPAPVWVSAWGAIVLDAKAGAKGVATQMASRSQAISVAMNECTSSGAQNCELQVVYDNQCAAVAWGDQTYGVANEPSVDAASARAIRACSRSGSGCKVVYTDCSLPRRIQ